MEQDRASKIDTCTSNLIPIQQWNIMTLKAIGGLTSHMITSIILLYIPLTTWA